MASENISDEKWKEATQLATNERHQAFAEAKKMERAEQKRRSHEKNYQERKRNDGITSGYITEVLDSEMLEQNISLPKPFPPCSKYRVFRKLVLGESKDSETVVFELNFEGEDGKSILPSQIFLSIRDVDNFLKSLSNIDELRANTIGEEYYEKEAKTFFLSMQRYKESMKSSNDDIIKFKKRTGVLPAKTNSKKLLEETKRLQRGSLGFLFALEDIITSERALASVVSKNPEYARFKRKMMIEKNELSRMGLPDDGRNFSDDEIKNFIIRKKRLYRGRIFTILHDKDLYIEGESLHEWAKPVAVKLLTYPNLRTGEQITPSTAKTRLAEFANILDSVGQSFSPVPLFGNQRTVSSLFRSKPFLDECLLAAQETIEFNDENNHLPLKIEEVTKLGCVFCGQEDTKKYTNMSNFNYLMAGLDTALRPQELNRLIKETDEYGEKKSHLFTDWDINYETLVVKTKGRRQLAQGVVPLNLLSHILIKNKSHVIFSMEPIGRVLLPPRRSDKDSLRKIVGCEQIYERRLRTTSLTFTSWCKHKEDDNSRYRPDDNRLQSLGGHVDMSMINQKYAKAPEFDDKMIRVLPGEFFDTREGLIINGIDVLENSCSWNAFLLKFWYQSWMEYAKNTFPNQEAEKIKHKIDTAVLRSFTEWNDSKNPKHLNCMKRIDEIQKLCSQLLQAIDNVNNATNTSRQASLLALAAAQTSNKAYEAMYVLNQEGYISRDVFERFQKMIKENPQSSERMSEIESGSIIDVETFEPTSDDES